MEKEWKKESFFFSRNGNGNAFLFSTGNEEWECIPFFKQEWEWECIPKIKEWTHVCILIGESYSDETLKIGIF